MNGSNRRTYGRSLGRRAVSFLLAMVFAISLLPSGAFAAQAGFDQRVTADGVTVRVRAQAGTFPADAVLSVTSVPADRQAALAQAVESERAEDARVAASYQFDVKVLDAAGDELLHGCQDPRVRSVR